ncbi:MAG: tetratricopeptide repeat protein [Brumimicrobium sp.]|nr:tetratricopeptide repeat protein [Brumimicrobium sp.]
MKSCLIVIMITGLTQLALAQKKDVDAITSSMNQRFLKALYEKGDEELAGKISDSLKLIYDSSGHLFSLYRYHNSKGTLEYYRGEYPKSLKHFNDALTLGEEHKDTAIIIAARMNVGAIFYLLNNYEEALSHYLQDAKLMEIHNKEGLPGLYGNIGMLYNDIDELDKAEFYLKRALELIDAKGEKIELIKPLNVLGIVQRKKGNYEESERTLKKALALAGEKREFYRDIADIHSSLSNLYNKTKEFDKERFHIQKTIDYYEKINNPSNIIYGRQLMAKFYLERGEEEKAEDQIKTAIELFKSSDIPLESKKEFFTTYAHILYAREKYKEAYDQLNQGFELFDTLIDLQKIEQVSQLETKYFYQQKMEMDSLKRAEDRKKQDLRVKKEKAESEKALAEQKFYSTVGIGGSLSLLVIAFVLFKAYRNKNKSNILISQQKNQLESKQTEILASIQYAKRIQTAILPPRSLVKSFLENSFILYKPKDVVAGDFYWMEHVGDTVLFAAADCTGHGVPGAMVSVICNSGLNRAVREFNLTEPDKILNKTREIVIQEFEKSDEIVKDGMDVSLVSLTKKTNEVKWAGANNPLWIIRKNASVVEEIKGDKQPIGQYDSPKPFTLHNLTLERGDSVYIFTDGFYDQFGGIHNKKFKSVNFKKLLLSIRDKTMEEQRTLLEKAFEEWKGDYEQVDDLCVIGVRL